MDFELSKEQKQIQKAVRDFVRGEFKKDVILELEQKHDYPVDIWKKAAALGLIGIHYPEKYSGEGLGVFENMLVAEALCRGDSSVGTCLMQAGFASEMILRFGSDEQKAAWLPKVAEGEMLSCGAFSEPDHGSDVTCVETTARRDGDKWVINGTKGFVINGGPLAGFYIVLCRTDPEAVSQSNGFSTILAEADRAGITTSDVGAKMGIRMIPTGEIAFNDARVPLSNLLGKENRGYFQVVDFFNEGRILVAAQAVGTAQGAFDRALAYTKQREQFGKKIVQFQITQHKLADMATKIELARLLTYKAAWNFDCGRNDPQLSSMAKMYAGSIAVAVCDEAIQLLGGYGYIQEYEVERYFRDAKMLDIHAGTKEFQKNTIAKALIGNI